MIFKKYHLNQFLLECLRHIWEKWVHVWTEAHYDKHFRAFSQSEPTMEYFKFNLNLISLVYWTSIYLATSKQKHVHQVIGAILLLNNYVSFYNTKKPPTQKKNEKDQIVFDK